MKPVLPASLLICILTGCDHGNMERQTPAGGNPDPAEGSRTFVYECPGGFNFVARVTPEQAWLFLPDGAVDLPRVQTGSGEQYADNGHWLHMDGDRAAIKTGTSRHEDCSNNRAKAVWEHAKLNGVDFRATGNEPGWYLEISNSADILLVTDYGQNRHRFASATLESELQRRMTTYKARNENHSVEIVISSTLCRDSMSGEPFPVTVSVQLDDTKLAGCGKALH